MGGPYVSLVRFSTFASKFLWISRDVVREEKLTINTIWKRERSFQKVVISSQYQREMLDRTLPSILQIHRHLTLPITQCVPVQHSSPSASCVRPSMTSHHTWASGTMSTRGS